MTTTSTNASKSYSHKFLVNLKKKLKDLSLLRRTSLTCNLWTSCQTKGYLSLTTNYVNSDLMLNNRVLNFCCF